MHQNNFQFEMPYEKLMEILQVSCNLDGKVRICVPGEFYVNPKEKNERPLQVRENEIALYGKVLTLSPNRFNFLRSFEFGDCVQESVIAQNVYHDQVATHSKIKKVADALEIYLTEKITFSYNHGWWTIIFTQT